MDPAADISVPRPEIRGDVRTNLFVLAMLVAGTAVGPVKVRNLSSSGALIEGASLPAPGDRIELRRADTCVRGMVMWCQGGKAGLRFDGRIDVSDWLPGGHAGQKRVDQHFQRLKAIPPQVTTSALLPTSDMPLAPAQLRKLARDIDSLADDLADDSAAVGRLAAKLQVLDSASQILRKLADRAN